MTSSIIQWLFSWVFREKQNEIIRVLCRNYVTQEYSTAEGSLFSLFKFSRLLWCDMRVEGWKYNRLADLRFFLCEYKPLTQYASKRSVITELPGNVQNLSGWAHTKRFAEWWHQFFYRSRLKLDKAWGIFIC